MARITRRKLLKLSASGAVAARTGGLAAILASGRAPAFAQDTTVHCLRWADFVPASDVLLKGPITQECQKATGITLKLETVNANDLQSRITSAIQSAPAPISSWRSATGRNSMPEASPTQRRGRGDRQGPGRLLRGLPAGRHRRRPWIGVPWTVGGGLIAYRKSWFEEVGHKTFPETWDALRDAGKKLKAKGRPLGQTAGHTFGDAPTGGTLPWSWGGKEVEADGKTVV